MTQALQQTWGERIRELRKAQGLSTNRLARLADIDPSHLWQAENGRAGVGDELRMRIAAALGVRVEEIWIYPDTSTREAS